MSDRNQIVSFCLQAILDEALRFRGQNELPPHEAIVVDMIGKYPRITMSELAKACSTLPNTLTGVIDRLVRRGFVRRRRDERDRRIVNVELTDLGKEAVEMTQEFLRGYAEMLLNRLAEDERDELIHLLQRITEPNRKM